MTHFKHYPLHLTLYAIFSLHLHHLAHQSLWGDEIFTTIFAPLPPRETINFTAKDIHPPLYYLLVGRLPQLPLWPVGPPSMVTDWLWRWPSVMLAMLSAAITYRLGRIMIRDRGSAVSLLALLLFALSPLVVKYGQEARMHALFMMLSALSTLCLALALTHRRPSYWVAYTLVTVLNLYTMYFSFLILAAQGGWVLVRQWAAISHQPSAARGQGSKIGCQLSGLGAFAIAATVALMAYLPWWPVLIRLLNFRAQVGAIEGGVGSPWAFLLKAVQTLGPDGPGAWLFFSLYWFGVWLQWRRDKGLAILGLLWLTLPLCLPLFLSDSRALQLRYAFIMPLYVIFVALGVKGIVRGFSRKNFLPFGGSGGTRSQLAFWILGSLFGLLSAVNLPQVYQPGKPNWREAAAFVAAQAGPRDVVVTGPLWDDGRFFGYYYPNPGRVMPPPSYVLRLPGIAAEMAAVQGRLWLVTRHNLGSYDHFMPHEFYGVTVMAQMQLEYDPIRLVETVAELCKKAARRADVWAAKMASGGVLTPDPRTSAAAGYRCQGDTYRHVGYHEDALKAYRRALKAFPVWAGGHALLAQTYLALDNLPAAAAAFAQAVALNPAWQGPQADEAARLAAQGQVVEAVRRYQEIVP